MSMATQLLADGGWGGLLLTARGARRPSEHPPCLSACFLTAAAAHVVRLVCRLLSAATLKVSLPKHPRPRQSAEGGPAGNGVKPAQPVGDRRTRVLAQQGDATVSRPAVHT